jgi:hypothetical protein
MPSELPDTDFEDDEELTDDRLPNQGLTDEILFKGRPLGEKLESCEILFGFIICSFFTFVGVIIGGVVLLLNAWIYHSPRWTLSVRLAATCAYPVLLVGQVITLGVLRDALVRRGSSRALTTALELGAINLPRRVIVGTWMFVNAVTLVLLSREIFSDMNFVNPSIAEKIFAYSLQFGVQFAVNFASNYFLLIAIVCLTSRASLARTFWRFRIVLDVVLALGVIPTMHL